MISLETILSINAGMLAFLLLVFLFMYRRKINLKRKKVKKDIHKIMSQVRN